MSEEKQKSEFDPIDQARLDRDEKKVGKGWSASQKINYLLFKIIVFVFIVVAMGMCSVKYIS